MNRVAHLFVALAVALPASLAGAAQAPMDLGVAEKLANTDRSAPQAAALKAAADAGDTARLVGKARAVLSDPALTVAERERLLFAAALGLRQVKPDAAAEALADELLNVPSTVTVWHGEGSHRVAMPRFEVAAAAASAKSHWQRLAARDHAASRIPAGPAAFPALFDASNTLARPELDGIEDAFGEASDAAIASWREALLYALPDNRQLDNLTATAARKLSDAALFEALVTHANAAAVLATLAAIPTALPPAEARQVLALAARRDALASASLLAMGVMANHDAPSTDYLFSALADSAHGGSAAAALAAVKSVDVTDRLAALLDTTDDDLLRRRCVLALRLTASDRAARALENWRQAPSVSPEVSALKAEAAGWLRR